MKKVAIEKQKILDFIKSHQGISLDEIKRWGVKRDAVQRGGVKSLVFCF